MKAKSIVFVLFMMIGMISLLCNDTLAQQDKEMLKKQLDNIGGKISKVVVESENGTETFTGENAELLGQLIKDMGVMAAKDEFIFLSDDIQNDDLTWITLDKFSGDGEKMEILIDEKDGNMKITVTTMENGEEKTVVYEGEEAEKFLEEQSADGKHLHLKNLNDEDDISVIIKELNKDDDKKIDIYIIDKDSKEEKVIIKKMKKDEDQKE